MKAHTTRIDMDTCKPIKSLNIKRNYRRKRGGKRICQRKWDYNIGIHHNLLQPLERSDKTFKNLIKLNMVLVNIQSPKPKVDMLIHHMQINSIDMGFVTETWTQYGNEPEYQYIKANLDTAGYNILIQSRENWRGGGIAVIYKSHLQVKKLSFNQCTSFKSLTINLNISTKSYLFSIIYRTPYSTKQPITMLTFLDEFPDHISNLLRSSRNISILGDFNIPWNISEHPDTTSMQKIMDMCDLKQHIHMQMHKLGNTLDWLISNSPNNILDIANKDFLSDHCIIEWKFQGSQTVREKTQTSRRDLSKIDKEKFNYDLNMNLEIDTGKTLQQNYNYMDAVEKTMDKHAPLISKTKTKKDNNPWFNKDSQRLITQQRMAEKRWIKSKEYEDLLEYKCINTIYKKYLHHAKKTHILYKLNDNKNRTRNLYNILRLLTKQKEENPMLPTESPSDVPNIFADFFLNKIQKIREWFHGQSTRKSYHRKCSKFTGFLPLEKEEILNIIKNMNPTTCITDACNTRFLLKFKEPILDAITIIVNQSLTTGEFLDNWKMAMVRPHIKGTNLDSELKNYRPISNLSFLSKITEKAAQLQLQKHFDQQSLLPNHQSAYRKHY